jgi:putative endonuclease
MSYFVYILICADDTLYTGIANDLDNRVNAHNNGKGAKYTSGRNPVVLAYKETCENKSDALKRELEIKKMTRAEKHQLCAIYNSNKVEQ